MKPPTGMSASNAGRHRRKRRRRRDSLPHPIRTLHATLAAPLAPDAPVDKPAAIDPLERDVFEDLTGELTTP